MFFCTACWWLFCRVEGWHTDSTRPPVAQSEREAVRQRKAAEKAEKEAERKRVADQKEVERKKAAEAKEAKRLATEAKKREAEQKKKEAEEQRVRIWLNLVVLLSAYGTTIGG